ncbi:MAG: hypothetical protein WBI41_05910 [Azovibrio sp.]|uniref:hypothetical protein n=1 Tax=Azovibrio sp. TaxID=1872673 RepID=UPI003C7662DD
MKQTLIALDQLANTLIYIRGDGWGHADETLSARLWRLHHPAHNFVDALFWRDREGPVRHCELSYRAELLRHHLPVGYRKIYIVEDV